MKFVDDFEVFLRDEVNLNQTRIDRLQQSVDAIEDALSGDHIFGKIFLDLIPAGSWAHRTIIRPVRENDEFDADAGLAGIAEPLAAELQDDAFVLNGRNGLGRHETG